MEYTTAFNAADFMREVRRMSPYDLTKALIHGTDHMTEIATDELIYRLVTCYPIKDVLRFKSEFADAPPEEIESFILEHLIKCEEISED